MNGSWIAVQWQCRDTRCRDTECRDTKCRDTRCRDTKCRNLGNQKQALADFKKVAELTDKPDLRAAAEAQIKKLSR